MVLGFLGLHGAHVADVRAQAPGVVLAEPVLLQEAGVVHRACKAAPHGFASHTVRRRDASVARVPHHACKAVLHESSLTQCSAMSAPAAGHWDTC